MIIEWTRIGPPVMAAFLGSLVEFIEALTIVIAVGTVRGWRSAMLGTSMGVLLLAVLVSLLGPALSLIPITLLQLAVGVLLLLFGMRWLRKAMLRAAGVIPLRDETQAFAAPPAGPGAREHIEVCSRNSHLCIWSILGRRGARFSLARQ
jgi:Ca2+/H+ antiporter, TMEM165/GDT1 family